MTSQEAQGAYLHQTILVLDACQRSALAAVRSLGIRGYRVITADSTAKTLAGCSRYSCAHWVYPDPYTRPAEFLAWAESALPTGKVQVALPMTEVTSDLLVRHGHLWPDIIIPFAPIERIDQLANKANLMRRAQELGIPIPATRYISACEDLLADIETLNYPVVLKPVRSRVMLDTRWLSTSVKIVHTPDELRTALDDEAFSRHPFLVQAFIEGMGYGVFALYNHGQPVAFFAHQRIRERPPWGGVSVLSESRQPEPQMQALAKTLLDDAQWHGVAMVEFKVNSNHEPYLMEINTRFWGSLQLAIDAGTDFPSMLVDMALGNPAKTARLLEGLRLRWILGDIDHLYLTLRSPRYSITHKLQTIVQLLRPDFSGRTRHEVNRIDDMRPAWQELKDYFGIN
jgi:predicted ATP-grasp superfamily ATP-dependent carboligase